MAPPSAVSPQLIRLSTIMAWLSTLGAIALPLVLAACMLAPDRTQWLMFRVYHLGADLTAQLPLAYRAGALAIVLIPTGFVIWALWSLRRLFLHFAHGEVFSADALRALNHVAAGLFLSVIVGFVAQAPVSYLLTWPLGAGHREISLGFGSDDVASLFTAGVVLVISRVMAEARRVADENASFV